MALLARVFAALSFCVLLAACLGNNRTPPDIDRLKIERPALSPDGHIMAFDFFEYLTEPTDPNFVGPTSIAFYHIETQSVEIVTQSDPIYSYYAPSFAGDNRTLVAMQHCTWEKCPPEDLGRQVVLLDLDQNRIRRITDGRKPTYLWAASPDGPPEQKETRIVRRWPVFVPSESAVYYMAVGREQRPRRFEGVYIHDAHQLLRADLETGEESLVMAPEDGPVQFLQFGRVALAGERRLVFSGGEASIGAGSDAYNEIESRAYFLDLDSKRLTPLFPDPPYFDESFYRTEDEGLTFKPGSLTSSADGRRIAFTDDTGSPVRTGVWLHEDDAGRGPSPLAADGVYPPKAITLSGDGRWLAALYRNQNRYFSLVDLESGEVRELPLQAPLRRALDALRSTRRTAQQRVASDSGEPLRARRP